MSRFREVTAEYFPYAEVRPHQDEFIETVLEAVENGRSALIEGSNGLGKTVAALSACLPKAIDGGFKILYVARTHRQHDRVIEELKAISKKRQVSGISIRSRHEMCLNSLITRHDFDSRSAMEVCELLKSRNRCPYYQKIEDAEEEYSYIQQQILNNPFTASEIGRICRKKGFCPYELAKSSMADMNVVSLSYLYLFDPVIRNPFLKILGVPLAKTILIVDEAHNLPETAAHIASNRLSLFTIEQAEAEAKRFGHGDIADFARVVKTEIEEMAREVVKEVIIPPESMIESIVEKTGVKTPKAFFEHMHDTGVLIRRSLLEDGKYPRSFIHGTGYFLLKWLETAADDSFVNVLSKYVSRQGVPTARLEIVALDPSKITALVFASTYSNIVMSGTLQPLEAHVDITKLPEDTVRKIVPSPFPKEHILPIMSCGVTTAMQMRTPQMCRKIIERIKEIVECTPANTGVFVPSFDFLGRLLAEGLKRNLKRPLFCEYRSMTSKENEKMVAQFKSCSRHDGAVLLGVQGGRSSEGVDFPGDEMNSVAVVGVPYAEPTPRVKAQISYFEKCFPGFGREYGYVLPAFKKASQAAGRPIRTLEDKGVIVFLDYRFATPYCQSFLPSWIRENLIILPDEDGAIMQKVGAFFRTVC